MRKQLRLTHSLFVLALVLVAVSARLLAAAPEITSVSPARGPTGGGTPVLINGSGFTGATQVMFGANNATSFVVQSDTQITATTPAGGVGLVDVTVTTPEGTTTLQEGFGYGTIPHAIPDSFTTPFNTTLSVNAPGVLANDDPNGGGGWVAFLGNNVANGTLTFTPDGGFTYTPNAGFVGTDTFSYRSQNNTGFSNFATVRITVGAPAAPLPPTDLYAADIRGNRVTLRFTPPAFGFTPTAYIIEGGPTSGSVASTIVTPPVPVFSFDAPTGAFFLRVRTQSGALLSGPSNEIQIFVNVPALPSAPENLLALVNGNSLTLTWRNTFAGGEPTSLVLDVTGSVVASLPVGFTDTATFNGVPAGTYTLALRAINGTGSSFPSPSVTVTIPGACSGAPLPPTRFAAYKIGSTIFVVWEPAASGPAPTGYVLNVTGSFVGSFPTTARGMSGTVGPGTYTLSVQATNACGASAATAAQTVTIP